jgi:signal transduction histidine kinase
MEPVIQSDLKQKQFITDAGHELKTPITVINTCLSVLEMEVGKQKWIDKAGAQTEKLKNLVNSLVTLAKSDEGREIDAEEFCVSDAVAETVGSFADFAAQKGHEITADIESGVILSGDEYGVRQLISILADNAVRYSDEGSGIAFSLRKHKKGVLITASNKCASMADEDLPKLFDRFYRADKSRSSESGGFGIGLSVARGICENHKGYIKAARTQDDTVEFTAYLSSI